MVQTNTRMYGAPSGVQGIRTVLAVPMLRQGVPVGAIAIRRTEVRPFTDNHIGLLKTFADQAVIAIENARLIHEQQARNRQLTEALEQQTATSEILRVISSSPTDLEPVFQTILANATRLCTADLGVLFVYEAESFKPVSVVGATPAYSEFLRRNTLRPGPRSGSDSSSASKSQFIFPTYQMRQRIRNVNPARLRQWSLEARGPPYMCPCSEKAC